MAYKGDWAEYLRKRRAAKQERGECSDCSSPALPGKKRCQVCLEKMHARDAHRAKKAAREHLCIGCGEKLTGRRRQCDTCRKLKRNHLIDTRNRRFAQGLCVYCGKEPVVKGLRIGKRCRRRKNEGQNLRRLRLRRVQEFRRRVERDPNGVAERLASIIRGRPQRVSDDELKAKYEELGTVSAVAEATDYVQADWVRRRLRKAGAPPGKPGRPRKEAI